MHDHYAPNSILIRVFVGSNFWKKEIYFSSLFEKLG
jgi:hypothetical protein